MGIRYRQLRRLLVLLFGVIALLTIAAGCSSSKPASLSTTDPSVAPSTRTTTDNVNVITGVAKDIVQIVAIFGAGT